MMIKLQVLVDYNLVFNPGLDEIVKVLKEQGPFYGVMGFSQGSAVAVALALLIEMKKIDLGYQLQCFIFVSAMASQLPYDQQLQCKTPSLHLIGLNDFVVDRYYQSQCRSIGLSVQFLNPYVIYHNQGHKVPTLTYQQIKQLKKFFDNPIQDWQQEVFTPKL
ncbi:hypothetical protein FGO68_gene15847 [Halteria grandinella]|uniref:Serine hydrolase domain-containing protein n=1 Tax=Halteria grandinella TaxID=5974 RepID=A0A8J8SV40_HALGN|nr:hypothetical protein FGO68_gene15847 [Halteria grandinella]